MMENVCRRNDLESIVSELENRGMNGRLREKNPRGEKWDGKDRKSEGKYLASIEVLLSYTVQS